jgi:hypothetical protein
VGQELARTLLPFSDLFEKMKTLGKLVVGGVSSMANVYDTIRPHDEYVEIGCTLHWNRMKMPKANCLGCGASRQEYAATAQTKKILLNDVGDRCVGLPHLPLNSFKVCAKCFSCDGSLPVGSAFHCRTCGTPVVYFLKIQKENHCVASVSIG